MVANSMAGASDRNAAMSRSSLNRQVLIPLVVTCLAAALFLASLSQWLAVRQAAEQSRVRLASVAKTLEGTSFPINAQVLGILQSLSGLEFVVCDSDGQLRGRSSGIDADSAAVVLERLPVTAQAKRQASPATIEYATELTLKGRMFRATILNRPSTPDSLLVLLEPQLERQAIQQQLALMPLVTGLVTLLFVGAVALLVSQRLVRRIADLEHSVRDIATGVSQRIVITGTRDQLSSLAESVNGMADELRSVWKTIRETERSRLLSQVAGGLAHQLRNAITGIHLAVQLHRRDCPLANQESLKVAEAELARTAAYIQQLLHSAAGKASTPESASLSQVLNETQSLLATIAEHRRISLTWQRDPASESLVVGDSELMRSAIMNLVLNALDAAGPSGNVVVATQRTDQATAIRVSDSGSGPAHELQENLFEPFVSSKPEGLGVGLTVVRSAAEAVGGEVRWCREQDRTVFEFSLPNSAG